MIHVNGEIYKFYLDKVFISTIHDAIHRDGETKYIEFRSSDLKIMEVIVPKELQGEPYGLKDAKYKVLWDLKS